MRLRGSSADVFFFMQNSLFRRYIQISTSPSHDMQASYLSNVLIIKRNNLLVCSKRNLFCECSGYKLVFVFIGTVYCFPIVGFVKKDEKRK